MRAELFLDMGNAENFTHIVRRRLIDSVFTLVVQALWTEGPAAGASRASSSISRLSCDSAYIFDVVDGPRTEVAANGWPMLRRYFLRPSYWDR